MVKPLINIDFLEEMGEDAHFRLPDMPELPEKLRNRVLPAVDLRRLFDNAVGLLLGSKDDLEAAGNEATMARNRNLSPAQRENHLRRSKVLRDQGNRRDLLATAKIIAITEAVAI